MALTASARPLQGTRIAILREHMVKRTLNHGAIVDQTNTELKAILRDKLGAELVETLTPDYPDDPDVPNVNYSFADAFSELLPRLMPEIFSREERSRASSRSPCPAMTSPRTTTCSS